MATGKRVPDSVKAQLVRAIESGDDTIDQVAKRHKLAVNTVKKWQRQLKDAAPTSSSNVKDAITFLEMAEKAAVQQLAGKKRARLTQPELYMMLALRTLKGG